MVSPATAQIEAHEVRVTNSIVALLAIAGLASGQTTASTSRRFRLFSVNKSCVCIATKKLTRTVAASEKRVGNAQFQIFKSRKTGAELFRVRVGSYVEAEPEKWWNYGIADEGDFNGDGIDDYSWYGGDDTGGVMYLFLSQGGRFTRVDILKTVAAEWSGKHGGKAPDFGDAGESYQISTTELSAHDGTLQLHADVVHIKFNGERLGREAFVIPQNRFAP